MGSVSSLVNGNSLNSKHCMASEHRSKKGICPHRKSGGCSLDELLKCGFTQGSSSMTQPSKGLSHSRSGRSEDFFYIKVCAIRVHLPQRQATTTWTSFVLWRKQGAPIADSKTPSQVFIHIILINCCLKIIVFRLNYKLRNIKMPSLFLLGTLSDSGRNSMSSLPTHSTSGSLSASTVPVSHSDGSSAPANSLNKGVQPNFHTWANGDAGSPLCSEEPSTLSETAGGIRSPITTDKSLIELLEQRLLERETELQELQVHFEDKEADTCQLFEERQRYCAEDMEGLEQRCSTKLRQVSQMAAKTQQALQLQVSQLQAEKERLQDDVSKLTQEKDLMELRLRSCATESTQLAPTLEETQWEVCQKTGEISLLKQQLRDCQADVNHKLNEIVCLRASLKENKAKMETLERQNKDHDDKLRSRTIEVEVCQNELQRKKNEADLLREKVRKLEEDIRGMKQDIAMAKERSGHIATESLQREVERLKQQLREEKDTQERLANGFDQERLTWNKEKDRVIKYQKQLQINYLQMHKKNQDLERILKELSTELESRTELGMDINYSSGLQTYEDVIATEI
uniref:Leucine zipper tumor suppressor 1 n=1 Tax=Cyclopterus lumpus TaxID=8103 RepID=A0A8C3ATF4_CYCLU